MHLEGHIPYFSEYSYYAKGAWDKVYFIKRLPKRNRQQRKWWHLLNQKSILTFTLNGSVYETTTKVKDKKMQKPISLFTSGAHYHYPENEIVYSVFMIYDYSAN